MTEEKTTTNNVVEYSRAELIKQNIDVACGCLFGLVCMGFALELLHVGFNLQEPVIGDLGIGVLIIIFGAIPAMAGMGWILWRCFDRPDFNSLPSARFAWGIPAIAMIIMVIIGCFVRGTHV